MGLLGGRSVQTRRGRVSSTFGELMRTGPSPGILCLKAKIYHILISFIYEIS